MAFPEDIPIKPQPAATILLLDHRADGIYTLMGKRHKNLKFLPDFYVFPGGRVEKNNTCVPVLTDYPRLFFTRLYNDTSGRTHAVKAITLAGIRELYEETGLILGTRHCQASCYASFPQWRAFAHAQATPDSSTLYYFARAITPRGHIRRFDTRFFLAYYRDILNTDSLKSSDELGNLCWAKLQNIGRNKNFNLKTIALTRYILNYVNQIMAYSLPTKTSIPFKFIRNEHTLENVLVS